MRKWDWDIYSIKAALEKADIRKVGKNKFEAYIPAKKPVKKLIFIKYDKEIFVITGAEGGKRK